MFQKETVRREVEKIFGNKVRIVTHFEVNRDGWAVRIYPNEDDDIVCLETWIDGLEELQNSGEDLLNLLRAKLRAMHAEVNLMKGER